MSRGLWKALTYSQESRNPHAHAELCTCPGKTRESAEVSPLAELEALCKQKGKAKAELSPPCWSITGESQRIHRGPQQRWETCGLKVFKEISV